MMTSFYYYDENTSGLCFLVLIRAFVIETSLGLPNKNMKGKMKRILVVVVKWHHRANGLYRLLLRHYLFSTEAFFATRWKGRGKRGHVGVNRSFSFSLPPLFFSWSFCREKSWRQHFLIVLLSVLCTETIQQQILGYKSWAFT